MARHFAVLAVACLGTGFAAASELTPESGHSIHLGGVSGTVYYTVEPDGFRVVATLGSGEATPIRFVSTLASGDRVLISVPQGLGEPSLDVEVVRAGEALYVNELVAPRAGLTDDAGTALVAR